MSQINRFIEQVTGAKHSLVRSFWFTMAWMISVVFHPLLMPTFLHGLVFKFCADLVPMTRTAKVQTLLFIFISTYLLPAMATGLLWVTGIITSLSLEKKSERLIPLLVTGIIYSGVSYIFLNYLDMVQILGFFMGIVAITVVLTASITHFWKISSHMVGIGGLVGFLASVISQTNNHSLLFSLIGSILAAGFVASARLYLQAHNGRQILAGFLLGLSISWTSVYFFV